MGRPDLEVGRRFARIENDVRDLKAFCKKISTGEEVGDSLKYQMEMGRVEDRLKKVEDQLEELLEVMT